VAVTLKGVGKTLLVVVAVAACPAAAAPAAESEVVAAFAQGFLNGRAEDVLKLIHAEFRAGEMDREGFADWLSRWFEWCDDYEFVCPNLRTSRSGSDVVLSGDFSRSWLLGVEASDSSIESQEEREIFGSLEEEGGAVKAVSQVEPIAFTLRDNLIVGIQGMTLSDPRGAAMGMRDPRVRKLGQFFAGLDKLPVIGGLFSSSESIFSGTVKSLLTLLVLAAAVFGGWVLLSALVTNLRLSSAMAKHSFAHGYSYQGQHAALIEHRELVASGQKQCKRHDFYLRGLIDEKRFADARDYVRGMVAYCTKAGDREGVETYTRYLKRVDELERDTKFAAEHHLPEPGHEDVQ